MRFKTDENVHPDAAAVLVQRGHDACTVWDQGLKGVADVDLAAICKKEGRVLVTFDIGFGDIRTYPPEEFPGIIVLRLAKTSRGNVEKALLRLIPMFDTEVLHGRLWIVDEGGLRVYGDRT